MSSVDSFFGKSWVVGVSEMAALFGLCPRVLIIERLGIQSGAAYSNTGFTRASKRVQHALNDMVDLSIVRLSDISARIALVFKVLTAVVKEPVLVISMPR